MRAPLPCQWSSRLPPCAPARPFESSGPSVATPTTPTIGFAGKRTRSFIRISPSRTSNSRVAGLGALHRHRPGRAVDAREVDLGDEVALTSDLAREAVVRLERDRVARF